MLDFLTGLLASTAKLTAHGRQSQNEYLQTPPIPTRHNQLRGLALLSTQPQSP